uniref:Uncharacterized protein n=1 Tax=Dunaliella tertiolecta TaxID=3047 RepID=A0A7S3VNP9_DUNTE
MQEHSQHPMLQPMHQPHNQETKTRCRGHASLCSLPQPPQPSPATPHPPHFLSPHQHEALPLRFPWTPKHAATNSSPTTDGAPAAMEVAARLSSATQSKGSSTMTSTTTRGLMEAAPGASVDRYIPSPAHQQQVSTHSPPPPPPSTTTAMPIPPQRPAVYLGRMSSSLLSSTTRLPGALEAHPAPRPAGPVPNPAPFSPHNVLVGPRMHGHDRENDGCFGPHLPNHRKGEHAGRMPSPGVEHHMQQGSSPDSCDHSARGPSALAGEPQRQGLLASRPGQQAHTGHHHHHHHYHQHHYHFYTDARAPHYFRISGGQLQELLLSCRSQEQAWRLHSVTNKSDSSDVGQQQQQQQQQHSPSSLSMVGASSPVPYAALDAAIDKGPQQRQRHHPPPSISTLHTLGQPHDVRPKAKETALEATNHAVHRAQQLLAARHQRHSRRERL